MREENSPVDIFNQQLATCTPIDSECRNKNTSAYVTDRVLSSEHSLPLCAKVFPTYSFDADEIFKYSVTAYILQATFLRTFKLISSFYNNIFLLLLRLSLIYTYTELIEWKRLL